MGDINRKMAHGAFWMVLFKLLERSIGLVSTVILVRLLLPADFGLVAMATSIIAVLELLGALNFDAALIQNPNAERRHYDTAFTFNVLFGSVCALLLLLLAWPAAGFYNEPRLTPVIAWLALSTWIGGFENIGVVAFRKNMRFDQEFKFLLAKKLIAFAVTVSLAFALRSYWALVVGMVTSRACGVVISYFSQAYRPRLTLSARHELLHFSRWLLLNNILFFLVHRSADFVIGKMAGPRALGLYSLSYEISNLPSTELVAPINRAVFPGYAKLADNIDALRKSFIDVTAMIAMLAVPAGIGVAAVAEPLVAVMLGPKWSDAAPLMEILAIYGVIGALQTNTGSIFLAIGKPRILTMTSLLYVVILLPLIAVGIHYDGARGAAWAFLVTALINMPVNLYVTFRHLQMRTAEFARATGRPLLAAGAMYAAVQSLVGSQQASGFVHGMGLLLLGVGVGAAVYIACLLLLWRVAGKPIGPERTLLDQLLTRLGLAAGKRG